MAMIHSDEFKRDAVRIATTSGLTRRQVASDLGVELSSLNKWVKWFLTRQAPPIQTRTFCARRNGFVVRTGFSRFESYQKTATPDPESRLDQPAQETGVSPSLN